MKLHLDQAAFTVLLDSIHAKTGYRTDVLEKDYYVTLMLEELAEKQKDALQRFGRLKIEATSFTISEPVMDLQVSAMLYDLADNSQRQILEAGYEVKPFQIQTMTLERIFIDKIFAAEAYTRKSDDPHRAFEAAKHIYDLSVMADHSDIERLYQDEIQMGYLLDIRMTEEKDRLDGVPGVLPKEFIFFSSVQKNEKIRQAYEIMQRQYVMRAADRISFDSAAISIMNIQSRLEQNTAWQKEKQRTL